VNFQKAHFMDAGAAGVIANARILTSTALRSDCPIFQVQFDTIIVSAQQSTLLFNGAVRRLLNVIFCNPKKARIVELAIR
jgi:hypothetical protein